MEILINDKLTIKELQQQFGNTFPYLKLEVFDIPPVIGGLSKSHICPNHKTLGACRKIHNEDIITIVESDTVEKLEQTLWEKFGLSVKVYRKSNSLWIETTLSNNWTLMQQNDEGRAFTSAKYFPN